MGTAGAPTAALERGPMELRKVQKLGPSSLFVTLPKSWVEKVGLKLGDTVVVDEGPDGSLRIVPPAAMVGGGKCLKVDLESAVRSGMEGKLLTCAYILGYDTIEFRSNKGVSREFVTKLNKYLENFMGMITLEASDSSVKVKCLIDPRKLDEEGIIKKLLSTLVDGIIGVIVENLKNGRGLRVSEEVVSEIKVLHNLVMRALVSRREDGGVQRAVRFVAAALFDMITDYMIASANALSDLRAPGGTEGGREALNEVARVYTEFARIISESLASLMSGSLRRAAASVEASRKLLEEMERLLETIIAEVEDPRTAAKLSYAVVKLADSIRVSSVIGNMAVCSALVGGVSWVTEGCSA